MRDAIDRAVQVIEGHVSTTLLAADIVQELDVAGLLATEAHDRAVADRAVAARALREFAAELTQQGADHVHGCNRDDYADCAACMASDARARADRIERGEQ